MTFDCDPLEFDNSLVLLKAPGLSHLKESIPISLNSLDNLSAILGVDIVATFFIRNLTFYDKILIRHSWHDFNFLWEEIIKRGHRLGLHPHIYTPLGIQTKKRNDNLERALESDFNVLAQMGEPDRFTRIGGHNYSLETCKLLKSLSVDIDSSVIPGRQLNKDLEISNWTKEDNKATIDWVYSNRESVEQSAYSITQVPMTTLSDGSQKPRRRYIDFSFSSFEEYFEDLRYIVGQGQSLVTITHPSTLMEGNYSAHKTLVFGQKNWIDNAVNVFSVIRSNQIEIRFTSLKEFTFD